jgi:ATP-dependent DNA ligase
MSTPLAPIQTMLSSEIARSGRSAFEFERDGFRRLACVDRGRIQVLSRRRQNYAHECGTISAGQNWTRSARGGQLVGAATRSEVATY